MNDKELKKKFWKLDIWDRRDILFELGWGNDEISEYGHKYIINKIMREKYKKESLRYWIEKFYNEPTELLPTT